MTKPDDTEEWVVLRFSDDMPEMYREPSLDGLWLPKDEAPVTQSVEAARKAAKTRENEHLVMEAVAVPTERWEERTVALEPGNHLGAIHHELQLAKVYEIRPVRRSDDDW
jgi:hypothetical protein